MTTTARLMAAIRAMVSIVREPVTKVGWTRLTQSPDPRCPTGVQILITCKIMMRSCEGNKMGRSSSSDARRLVGLCFSFFVLFSAFYAAQTQVTPTLGAFGSLSLGLLYGCLSLAAPLAPAALRCLGRGATRESLQAETRALALASFLYCPFMAACARTSAHGAQLATSALLGLAAGLLWVAQGSLLTASTTSENRGRWSGVF